jgi:hypothetical protein
VRASPREDLNDALEKREHGGGYVEQLAIRAEQLVAILVSELFARDQGAKGSDIDVLVIGGSDGRYVSY